jgi:catechol 2,3-dioxygenase-like lactoylglutathione lyase family enzyme
MKMIKSIPAIPVRSIEQSVNFYSDRLGFFVSHQDDGFAILIRDDVEIHFWAASDNKWKGSAVALSKSPVISGAESFLAGTASCRIEVTGIDELFEEYKKEGVTYNPNTVIETKYWGTREFPALDHHRNLLTFYENIGS